MAVSLPLFSDPINLNRYAINRARDATQNPASIWLTLGHRRKKLAAVSFLGALLCIVEASVMVAKILLKEVPARSLSLPPVSLCLFHYGGVAGAKDLVSRHDASSEIGHNKQPPIKIPYYSGTKRAARETGF